MSDLYGAGRVRSSTGPAAHRTVEEPRCPNCGAMWAVRVTTPFVIRCRKCQTVSEST